MAAIQEADHPALPAALRVAFPEQVSFGQAGGLTKECP